MTTIEGNILIAEFMGCKLMNNGKYEILDHPYNTDGDSFFSQEYDYSPQNLAYDVNWNWIMPVVKKIVPPNGWLLGGIKYQSRLMRTLQLADIDLIWLDIVDFIKWYNGQTQQDGKLA